MGELFRYSSFNQNINNWDVSNVDYMYCMFANMSYNQPLDKWNTSKVTDMRHMFMGNNKFNQDISNWDVSNVTRMNEMFSRAKAFDQDISGWSVNIKDQNELNEIFKDSGLVKNYNSSTDKKSTNLCKIYNSSNWNDAVDQEIYLEIFGNEKGQDLKCQ